MHLFFDTVWKLHIGEIPEKPDPKNYLYPGPLVSDLKQYENTIAAIKQNAITVGNPILCPQNMSAVEPGKFYEWIGGYDIVGMGTVAILTLPEEKKNTMENITKEQAAIKWLLDTLRPFENMEALGPLECFKIREIESLIKEPTASGSVAAPKEETSDNLDLEKFMLSCPFDVQKFVFNQADRIVSIRQQLKEREEALKELLSLAVRYRNTVNFITREDEFDRTQAIIERARKLLSK